VVIQVIGYKQFGNGQPLDIQVGVTDMLGNPISNATVNVSASNGAQSWSGTLAPLGGQPGFYRVCNAGSFNGGATSILISANASLVGYNSGSGGASAQNGNLNGCP